MYSTLLLAVSSLVFVVTRSCGDVCSATVDNGTSTYYKIECIDNKSAITYFLDENCESSQGSYLTDEDCLDCSAYIIFDATSYKEGMDCQGSDLGAHMSFMRASGSADDNGCFSDNYNNTIAYTCGADGTSFTYAVHSDDQCSGGTWATTIQADVCNGNIIISNIRCVGMPETQADDTGFTYSFYESKQCDEDLTTVNRFVPPAAVVEQGSQGCVALDDGSDTSVYVHVRCEEGTAFSMKSYDNAECEGAYESLLDYTETCIAFGNNSALVSDITCSGTAPLLSPAPVAAVTAAPVSAVTAAPVSGAAPYAMIATMAALFLMMWV